jgi:hypothetical protein
MTAEQNAEYVPFAEGMADYLATRNKPWADEETMREAVSEVFRVMFGDQSAFHELRRLVAQIDRSGAP